MIQLTDGPQVFAIDPLALIENGSGYFSLESTIKECFLLL